MAVRPRGHRNKLWMTILLRLPSGMWLRINQEGLRRFGSMFPLTRGPFWYRSFHPQPVVARSLAGSSDSHLALASARHQSKKTRCPGMPHMCTEAAGHGHTRPQDWIPDVSCSASCQVQAICITAAIRA